MTNSVERLLSSASDEFRLRFGRPPAAAAYAPGRVNLIGDHTDYNEGFALPMAIDRGVVVVAAPSGSARCRVVSLALDEEIEFEIGESPKHGWSAYAHGVAIELGRIRSTPPGFDAVVAGDIPLGAGLSSSAALEVATCLALESLHGDSLDPMERAMLCRRAECEHAGTPCGLMDQLVACRGVAGAALLIDFRSNSATPIPVDDRDVAIVIAHSGVTHALGDGVYAQRRADCERAAGWAGVRTLRDLGPDGSARLAECGDEAAKRRARHAVSENERTLAAAEALRQRRYDEVGRLMVASHASLRDDFEASCPQVESLVAAALETPGVYGARMTGGGFGGCVVALVRADAAEACVERLSSLSIGPSDACFIAHASACAGHITI